MRRRKGQSILEYVIVLTVIIAAIAMAAKTHLSNGISTGFENAGNAIETATGQLVVE